MPEDAYDPEPSELRCSRCGYDVEGGGAGGNEHDEQFAGRLTVDDPCRAAGAFWFRGRVPAADGRGRPGAARVRLRSRRRRTAARGARTGEMPGRQAIGARGRTDIRGGYFAHEGRITDDVMEVPSRTRGPRSGSRSPTRSAPTNCATTVAEDKIEPEANAFAWELLIPRLVWKCAVGAGLTLVAELRRLFDVSFPAARNWALEDASGRGLREGLASARRLSRSKARAR